MRAAIVGVISLSVCVLALDAKQDPQKSFSSEWKGRAVVLKREFFTAHIVAEGGLGTTPRKTDEAVLLVKTGGPTLFKAPVNGKEFIDDDIERLLNQLKTKVNTRSFTQSALGSSNSNVGKTGVELSKFQSGEEFVVLDVSFKGTDVLFKLAKTFSPKVFATGLTIRMDQNISKDLGERAKIEQLLQTVVTMKR
jgi:hypothetical protein